MAPTHEKPTRVVKYYYPFAPFLTAIYAFAFLGNSLYRQWSFYYPANRHDVTWQFVLISLAMFAGIVGVIVCLYKGLRRRLRYEITPDRLKTIVYDSSNNVSSQWESPLTTIEFQDVQGVDRVWADRVVFRMKDDSTFTFPMQGLSKFKRRQALEIINTNLQIPNLLKRANCEHAQPFQFSIYMLLVTMAIGAVTFAGFRLAVEAGVAPFFAGIMFTGVLGLTSFVMILGGMAGLVATPTSKWAHRFVNYGGFLLAALFVIALILPVLYMIMGAGVSAIDEFNAAKGRN